MLGHVHYRQPTMILQVSNPTRRENLKILKSELDLGLFELITAVTKFYVFTNFACNHFVLDGTSSCSRAFAGIGE